MHISRRARFHTIAIAAIAIAGACLVACATSGTVGDADGEGGVGDDSDDGGVVQNKRDAGHATPFDEDTGPPANPDQPLLPDAGSTAADSGGSSNMVHDAGNNPASCAAPNACATAADIGGSISGDTGSDTKNVNGIVSKWISVRVTENDGSIIGKAQSFRADLVSPPGANFDLYVYANAATDVVECNTPLGQSTNAATPQDSVSVTWGEGTIANDADDSRTVSIEIRYVSGSCDPNDKWTLTVTGD